jgi:hypothetical protein
MLCSPLNNNIIIIIRVIIHCQTILNPTSVLLHRGPAMMCSPLNPTARRKMECSSTNKSKTVFLAKVLVLLRS